MARTLRSKKLRAALWRSTGGKCACCGCELIGEWHADHVVPWVKTKTTNVHQMQPLCRGCNLKKGSKT
jgi:5-methylcytosine-specific restriction endonuclease McrA